jgi:EEF1A lysine methyltransferase 1
VHCRLQFDTKFASEKASFVYYDFNRPDEIPSELQQTADFVVIDPPFITRHVWEQYATATKMLAKPATGKIVLTTIGGSPCHVVAVRSRLSLSLSLSTAVENEALMLSLLDCTRQRFKPSIPHLVYQYALFANYPSRLLNERNPEVDNDA